MAAPTTHQSKGQVAIMPRPSSAKALSVPEPGVSKLQRLAAKYKAACADEADAKARKQKYAELLLPEVKSAGDKETVDGKVRWRAETDVHKLVTVSAVNRYVDPKKLAELNVRQSIIRKATVETPYEYVLVTAKG